MFITNLLVLFFGSWLYTRGQEAIERLDSDPKKRAKVLRLYILLCLGCVLVSAAIVIMEAYALLALQFCDGEDLMSLYWSTWTMIQVGSLIAIMGIILALGHSLRNRKHPPWALALGTPVLVIAGVLHLIHDCTKKRVKKLRRPNTLSSDDSQGPPISQANTIQNARDDDKCSDMQAEFIGFTIEGGPIVKFTQPVSQVPQGELLGYDARGCSTFAFSRGVVRFESDGTGR
ncbi:hypothetical protein QQS21_002598 [Conoideocrella luteorostrata]|uniref:Uncharacterized protein n=1 Tax=Conoideocrella luteorostrata TaxID=1105319 RepID=A0AAJ0G153_9HYPO|nr:hypothetical protein QQS21_002598 [Conoideocrella luteorostrata]